jgi:hypothetical protein
MKKQAPTNATSNNGGQNMIKRDTFDYTEWRRGLWNDMTIEEIFAEASTFTDDNVSGKKIYVCTFGRAAINRAIKY